MADTDTTTTQDAAAAPAAAAATPAPAADAKKSTSALAYPSTEFKLDLGQGAAKTIAESLGGKAIMGGAGAVYRIDPANISDIPDFNVRIETPDYLQHIEDLKLSIRANGFYGDKPISGYAEKDGDTSKILLTDGYSRMRAVRELIAEGVEIATVPVILKPAGQSLEDLTVALVTGNEGRKLNGLEKGIVAKRLLGMGLDEPKVAERLGMTERYLSDLMVLVGSSASVRRMVATGKVSATEAIKQVRKDAKGAGGALEKAVKEAQAAGKSKATGKDVKKAKAAAGDGEGGAAKADKDAKLTVNGVTSSVTSRNNKVITTLTYLFKQGAIVTTDSIRPIQFFQDGDFWDFVDEKTDKAHVVINEDIKVTVSIETKEKDDRFADGADESKTGDEGGAADPASLPAPAEGEADPTTAETPAPAADEDHGGI